MMYLARICEGQQYITPVDETEIVAVLNGRGSLKKDTAAYRKREPRAWKTRTGAAAIDHTQQRAIDAAQAVANE